MLDSLLVCSVHESAIQFSTITYIKREKNKIVQIVLMCFFLFLFSCRLSVFFFFFNFAACAEFFFFFFLLYFIVFCQVCLRVLSTF